MAAMTRRSVLFASVLVAFLLLSPAGGPAGAAVGTGTWRSVAPMAAARSLHTGVLLTGAACTTSAPPRWCGQVLVAGGRATAPENTFQTTSSAELFDSGTGTWRGAAAMKWAREGHTATVLPDGRVLVIGGLDLQSFPISEAEVYDPGRDTWSSAGYLSGEVGLTGHTATLLGDGRVLVAGGEGPRGLVGQPCDAQNPSAQVWDPGRNTFFNGPCMTVPRRDHTATRLGDGRVLVAGGIDPSLKTAHTAAEVYLPSGDWTKTASLRTGRTRHAAALISGGRVLAVGGSTGSAPLASAETWDPLTGQWAATGAMTAARDWTRIVSLVDGAVLAAGGARGATIDPGAELFDPSTGTWTSTASMGAARGQHVLIALAGGAVVLAAGGHAPAGRTSQPQAGAERYFYTRPPGPGPGGGTIPPGTTPGTGTTRGTTGTIPPGPGPGPGPGPAGCTPAPVLLAQPPVAPLGFSTTVSGSGFCPGTVTLSWSPGLGTVTAAVDAGGTFRATMILFPKDIVGPRLLIATGAGGVSVQRPFLVVPSSLQPPDFVTR